MRFIIIIVQRYCKLIFGRVVSLTVRCRKIYFRVLLNNVTYILPSRSIFSFCLTVCAYGVLQYAKIRTACFAV